MIDKTSQEFKMFEILFSSRRIKYFRSKTRTSVHIDIKETGKRLIFIAKDDGTFFHYLEDFWHPDTCQGAPFCMYEFVMYK